MLYNNTVTHTPHDPDVFLNNLQALKAVRAGHREAVDNLCKWYSSPSQLICNCICSLFLCLTGRQKRDTWPRHKDKDTKGVIREGWKGVDNVCACMRESECLRGWWDTWLMEVGGQISGHCSGDIRVLAGGQAGLVSCLRFGSGVCGSR